MYKRFKWTLRQPFDDQFVINLGQIKCILSNSPERHPPSNHADSAGRLEECLAFDVWPPVDLKRGPRQHVTSRSKGWDLVLFLKGGCSTFWPQGFMRIVHVKVVLSDEGGPERYQPKCHQPANRLSLGISLCRGRGNLPTC